MSTQFLGGVLGHFLSDFLFPSSQTCLNQFHQGLQEMVSFHTVSPRSAVFVFVRLSSSRVLMCLTRVCVSPADVV